MLLKPSEDPFNALTLLLILYVVNARAHEEPDAVCEEEVDRARTAQNLTELFNFNDCQLRVQVETAELGDKEFEVSSCCLVAEEVRVEANLHE